jgi:hypothetical protein
MERQAPTTTREVRPADGAAAAGAGIPLAPRSEVRAALYSLFFPGGGQIYNKQLDKAVLLWIWMVILGILASLFGVLTWAAGAIPAAHARPPLADWAAEHRGLLAFGQWAAALLLWGAAVRDAYVTAGKLNRGEVIVEYPMRRQLVHLVGSQLLGFIPIIGFLFPPAVVAEGLDSLHQRRRPDARRLVRHGGQALVEWALTRIALYAVLLLTGLWLLWWLLQALGR